jgi:hypothetical protein
MKHTLVHIGVTYTSIQHRKQRSEYGYNQLDRFPVARTVNAGVENIIQ